MVSSSHQAIACILLLLSTVISAAQTTADKTQTSSISGKVTLKGKGVSGVVVGLEFRDASRAFATRFRAVTDDEGKYRITNVPPGAYEVIVSAPVYVPIDRQKSVILGKNETIEDIDFALIRGGVITGRVTDPEGRPAVEEEVYFSTPDPRYHPMQPIRTDDRGVYRMFGVPPGRYRIYAGKGENESFGDPWVRAGYKRTFHPNVTDESQATTIEVTEGSEARDVDITLARALTRYSASGRVVDGETGQPLANVPFGVQMFVSPNGTNARTTGAVTGKNGEFTIPNLSPGKYAVFAEAPVDSDWLAESVRFEVNDQDVKDLLVKTSKGASVSGVIVLEGSDDKTVRANLMKSRINTYISNKSSGSRSNPSTPINPDGSFRLSGLAPGTVNFWLNTLDHVRIVRVERDGVSYTQGLEIKPQEQITGLRVIVVHANASIRGVLKLASGSLPPNAQFFFSMSRPGDDPYSAPLSTVQVDARGQFVAEGLLPGTYQVYAGVQTNEFPPTLIGLAQQIIEVTSGAVTNVTITLQPPPPRPNRP